MYLGRIRRVSAVVVSMFIAAAGAEVMVRAAMSPALDYSSIFKPGIYCPDDTYGLVPCPNHKGAMHVAGGRDYIAYRTGHTGFRGPFSTRPGHAPTRTVVLIGGQSQGFGFGLRDQETFASALAQSSRCGPMDVHSISAPGISNSLLWKLFERGAKPARIDDLVLIVYWPLYRFWQYEVRNPEFTKLFWYSRLWPWWTPDPLGRDVDRLRLATLDGWHFVIPAALPPFFDRAQIVVRAIQRFSDFAWLLHGLVGLKRPKFEDAWPPPTESTVASGGGFITYMQGAARELGATLSVVIIPNGGARFRPSEVGLDPDRFMDTDALAREAGLSSEVLPDAHYNARLAGFIGRRIGDLLCRRSSGG
jgi:hypothetical protein